MLTALLLAALLQDDEIIPKSKASAYLNAFDDCKKAADLIDSDPRQAIGILDRVISNSNIDAKDRRLRVEKSAGNITKGADFFPHQLRGRAKLKLSETDKKNAETLLDEAIKDFESSQDGGVKTNGEFLKSAKSALEKLKTRPPDSTKDDPEPKLREEWNTLLGEKKFKSAAERIASKGTFLEEPARKKYLEETEAKCRAYVAGVVDRFLEVLAVRPSPEALREMKRSEFDRALALPEGSELVGSHPILEWARKERATLERLRNLSPTAPFDEASKMGVELLSQATAASSLKEKSEENEAFRIAGLFAVGHLDEMMKALTGKAGAATPEVRTDFRKDAEKVRALWSDAAARVPAEVLERYPEIGKRAGDMSKRLDEFPVDLADIDAKELESCLAEANPDAALEKEEQRLGKIREDQGPRLSADSARRLYTRLAAASAMRLLLGRKSVDEVISALKPLGRELAQAGGPLDPKRWGPKIEKILKAIQKS